MSGRAELVTALAAYALLVVGVGLAATRRAGRSPEEYFLAGRRLGTLVLFMALFGTNCTAFVLVGVPGLAYHQGVGVFGVNAAIVALGIPLSFWWIGSPARRMARRLGALTPAELYARRFESRGVGFLLFAVFTLYTLPYMATAVDGAAVTLAGVLGGGEDAERFGGLLVLAIAWLYTSLGGMRATAWTNVIQGAIFLVFMTLAFWLVPRSLGGFGAASAAILRRDPALLVRGEGGLFTPQAWSSWALAISLCVIAFPHMLVRLFTARSESAMKSICRLYPPALALLWLPAVMLGLWGAALFPGLEGRESDRIFALVTSEHLPGWLGPFAFLAVLAAVMSTLDAQLLTLSSMLTRDVLDVARGSATRGGRGDVRAGRWFGVLVAAVVFLLWRTGGQSIFRLASVAFSGYVTLVPTLAFGVRWRRFSTTGAVLSVLAGNAVYGWLLARGGGLGAVLAPSIGGFLPVFWALAAACGGALAGTWLGPRPGEQATEAAFGPAPRALRRPSRRR